MHGRTKGSRNGVSTTPGYVAKGKKAVGRLINGVYVYANNAVNTFVPKPKAQTAAQRLGNNLSAFAKNRYNTISKFAPKPKKQVDKLNTKRFVNALTNNALYGAGKSIANNVSAVNKQKALKAQADASYNKNQKFENRPAKYKYTNYGVDKLAKKAEQQARLMNEANTSYKKQQMLNSGNPANNWQQQGNYYRAISEYLDKKNAKEKANQEHAHKNASNQADAERAAKEKATAYASKTNATNSAASAHQNAVDQAKAERYARNAARYKQRNASQNAGYTAKQYASNQAEAERAGRNAAYEYSKKSKASGAHQNAVDRANAERTVMNAIGNRGSSKSAHQNAVSQAAAERKAREAALGRQKKASKKKSAILTNVRMMPTNNPKDKYDYSGKNDDRAPVFKEATYIDIYGNKTGGKVTKMDRTPYWDSMVDAKTDKEFDKYAKKSKEFLDDFRASKIRNSRSDIGNAFADAKEDAKSTFKALKSKIKKKKK